MSPYLANCNTACWCYGYKDWCKGTTTIVAKQKYHVIAQHLPGAQSLVADNVTVLSGTLSHDKVDVGCPLYLFCYNQSGSPTGYSVTRCYSLKIWDETGALVRDFRPCVKNGEPCLYDTKTAVYFRNKAATPLEAGERVVNLEEALFVTASPVLMGEPVPGYGIHKMSSGDVTNATLAAATINYQGEIYSCRGYRTETSSDGGSVWENPVEHAGTSFDYTFAGAYTRLTWKWEKDEKCVLEVPVPSTGIVAPPQFSVASGPLGEYDRGTEVAISVTNGTGEFYGTNEWDDAVFDHWEGDVPEGLERTNPLTVTMDRPRRIVPIFAHEWVCRANDVDGLSGYVMCDGYWTIRIVDTTAADGSAALLAASPAAWELATILDYRKHIRTTKGKTIFVSEVKAEAFDFFAYSSLGDRGAATLCEVRLNDELETIGPTAFRGCPKLTTVTPFIPTNVTEIGKTAFSRSPVESDLTLGGFGKQVHVGDAAFYSNALTRVTLGEGVVSGERPPYAPVLPREFMSETPITEFVLPPWVEGLGDLAFKNCHSLTNVDLSAAPILAIPLECFMDCENLRTVKLPPKTLKRIERHGFYISEGKTGSLERVEPFLPESLEFIGDDVFNRQMVIVQPLEIGSRRHVLELGSLGYNFYQMESLKKVTIRGGVTNLPCQCFYRAETLDDFYFADEDMPAIDNACFNVIKANNSRFYIPRDNASWAAFVDANVTPWDKLTDAQRKLYTDRFGKPPRTMIGMAAQFGNTTKRFFLWLPPPSGTMLILK